MVPVTSAKAEQVFRQPEYFHRYCGRTGQSSAPAGGAHLEQPTVSRSSFGTVYRSIFHLTNVPEISAVKMRPRP
jgi:hypothetical protein